MKIKLVKIESYARKLKLQFICMNALSFFPFHGGFYLFDLDEINFAEFASDMSLSQNYLNVQIDFLPFTDKPPLLIWMQVVSMKGFGINEIAARLPNAVSGVV